MIEFFKNIIWGFCGWEIFAIVFTIAAIAIFVVRRIYLNKQIKKFKDQS
ncbi:MAG: hypothetical protein NC489_17480 [Ruminococcus flavefaciens]|nr:hypothetical protein [Ruminococcus flavefaciens]